MKFEEFEAQLQQQLDRRQPVELTDEMRAAVAADPDCLRLYQAHAAWQAALAQRPRPEPPLDLAARVLNAMSSAEGAASDSTWEHDEDTGDAWCEVVPQAEVNRSGAGGTSGGSLPGGRSEPGLARRLRPWLMWGAAAASIAISTMVLVDHWNAVVDPAPVGPGGLAVEQPGDSGVPRDGAGDGERDGAAFASVSQLAQEQYQALAAETRASLSDLSVLMPEYPAEMVAVAPVDDPGHATTQADVAATANDGVSEGASDGSSDQFRPFKESTRGAMGLLMRFTPR